MPDQTHVRQSTASVEQRVDAIQAAFDERGMKAGEFIDEFKHLAEEQWVPENGARVVAKAWTDPAFRQRLLANGRDAVAELGLTMPAASPPSRGAGEHADGAERHLLHAVLVHGLLDHRPAAGLVQGSRVPRPASCASRARCSRKWASTCRRRSRSACGTRRRTPRYMVLPVQPPETHRLVGGQARRDRHRGFDDRRRAPVGTE
mgnify:CR=1 FL=1